MEMTPAPTEPSSAQTTVPVPVVNSVPTSVQLLHAVLRFARVARFRWTLVAASALGVATLGVLYFATVDRVYQARAQLLVQQTGPIATSTGTTEGMTQQGMLPTYERLFTSTVVLEGAIQRLMDAPRERRIDFIGAPRDTWVAILRNNVSVRSLRLTNVIEIAYGSRDPKAAEAVVQALLESYTAFMKSNHQTVAEELVTILRKERRSVESQLHQKERELVEAKRRFGDIGLRDATKTLHPLVQRVVRINDSLIEVQQDRFKLEATLAAVDKAIVHGTDLRQHLFAIEPVIGREVVLAAMGLSEQDEATVARLEQKLLDEQSELDSIDDHFGSRHPKIQRLSDSIRQTHVYLANYQQTVDRRSERLQDRHLGKMLRGLIWEEYQKSREQERILSVQYQKAQSEAVQLQGQFEQIAILQREVDRLLNFDHTLLNHIGSIDINQNQSDVRVEVVSRPQSSRRPVSPNAMVVVAVCLIGSLSLGTGLVYVVDVLDDRFRSLDEMKAQLQTPVLAMVRQLESRAPTGLEALQVHVAPDAVESEAFRTLRTTLAFADESMDCVAISSSEPGDGKTTIVANLGVSFAQTGKRTLLIDADLRRPGLTRLFSMKGQQGLTEALRDGGELADTLPSVIRNSGRERLDLLPSGIRPLDPIGLLSSPRFGELLAWASAQYDQVLVDSPPLLVASDAAVVGRMTGGLMLVVQPQKNHRRLVVRAIEEARSVGLEVIGVIVNRLSSEAGQSYYGHGYGYGYGYGNGNGYGYGTDEHESVDDDSDLSNDEAENKTPFSERTSGSSMADHPSTQDNATQDNATQDNATQDNATQDVTVEDLIARTDTQPSNVSRLIGFLRRKDAA